MTSKFRAKKKSDDLGAMLGVPLAPRIDQQLKEFAERHQRYVRFDEKDGSVYFGTGHVVFKIKARLDRDLMEVWYWGSITKDPSLTEKGVFNTYPSLSIEDVIEQLAVGYANIWTPEN